MLEILNKYIIGQLGDQSGTLWLGSIFYTKKFELLNSFSFEIFRDTPQDIYSFLFSNIYNFIYLSFSYLIGPIFAYNLITFFVLCLNSYFLYKLFKYLKVDKLVAIFFSFLFNFIPYFYLHFEHHTLLFFFPSIYALFLTFKTQHELQKFDYIKLGIAILLQMLFSIYLGYFLLIYLFIFYLLSSLQKGNFKRFIFLIKSILIFGTLYLIVSFQFILNLAIPDTSLVKYNYPESFNVNEISSFEFDRVKPLDDFIFFTSRPWYFLLPPTNHFLFGDISKDFISYFAEEKNLFLFKNHFPYEHGTSYLGYFIFITSLFALFKIKDGLNKDIIRRLALISLIISILMMPPVIFFYGSQIYTPSYLLYLLFPMFRTLARFSVFIHLSLFIISAIYISENLKNKSINTKLVVLSIISLVIIFEYTLKYKIVPVPTLTESGEFISSFNKNKNLVAAYPSSFRTELLLNMINTNSPQINPSGFNVEELNFDSSKFTRTLENCVTLKYFYEFGGRLIIIKQPVNLANTDLEKFITVFESLKEKVLVKDISNINQICQ